MKTSVEASFITTGAAVEKSWSYVISLCENHLRKAWSSAKSERRQKEFSLSAEIFHL